MAAQRVLVVEDEQIVREAIGRFLGARGFEVEEAPTFARALEAMRVARPDAVVMDYRLPDGDGLECLSLMRKADASLPCVMLTGHGTVDLAVRALKGGAEHFLQKPVEMPALVEILRKCIAKAVRPGRASGRFRVAQRPPNPFLGVSAAIRELEAVARKVAGSSAPVLIVGETGSGKSVLARFLHDIGPRSTQPFIDLNCAGLTRELVENELFGHERGAYTGAHASKAGLFEAADTGTLFLDEIGDIDQAVQPKLLKAIEEQRIRRVGDVRGRDVDVRLIFASHQDLAALVQERRFREDLYFRINTLPLRVPPLRERREDIVPLSESLLATLAADMGRVGVELTADAQRALVAYPWPGNVRQLRNVLERALLMGDSNALTAKDLRFDANEPPPRATMPTSLTLEEVERQHIEAVLGEEGGRVESAARRLGVPRSSLYQKLKRFGIALSRV